MTYLSLDDISKAVAAADIATDDLDVPELGGTVRIRELSGALRNRLEAAVVAARGGDSKQLNEVITAIVERCVIDENGQTVLDTATAKRIVARVPKAAFRIRDKAISLSALDESDREALEQDFDETQGDASISG